MDCSKRVGKRRLLVWFDRSPRGCLHQIVLKPVASGYASFSLLVPRLFHENMDTRAMIQARVTTPALSLTIAPHPTPPPYSGSMTIRRYDLLFQCNTLDRNPRGEIFKLMKEKESGPIPINRAPLEPRDMVVATTKGIFAVSPPGTGDEVFFLALLGARLPRPVRFF